MSFILWMVRWIGELLSELGHKLISYGLNLCYYCPSIPTGSIVDSCFLNKQILFKVDPLLFSMTEDFDKLLFLFLKDFKLHSKEEVSFFERPTGIQFIFRQLFLIKPIRSIKIKNKSGDYMILTIDEITIFKAVLVAKRNHIRDFMEFASLTEYIGIQKEVIRILTSINKGSDVDWTFAIAKSLLDPNPSDLDSVGQHSYDNLEEHWNDWSSVKLICQKYGQLLIVNHF